MGVQTCALPIFCHIALSAASRRISDFEAAAEVQLFERSSQGISLTPAGHVALQHALRLFHGFERFSSELANYSQGIQGYVRLWASTSALNEFLPISLASFLKQHPDVRVDVEEHRSEEHTSELQSLMRISYAVFCLKKKKKTTP